MSLRSHVTRNRLRHAAPEARLATPIPARAPVWPTVSIVVLMCATALLPPIALTVMDGALVMLALGIVLMTNQSVDRRLLHFAVPFVLICFIGLASGVGAERYPYLKDAWYVMNPVLVLLTGYVLYAARPDLGSGLRAFVIGGALVALWQMRGYLLAPEVILLPADTVRRIIGTGYYAPVLALVILLVFAGRWRAELRLRPWIGGTLLVFIGLAVIGVFSRSALLVALIGLTALAGCFARREWLRLGIPLMVVIGIAYSMPIFVDVESDRALKTYLGKLARTVHELTVNDYAGIRDINLSFRGHETARAMDQYLAGNAPELLFGRGFAATVDLGVFLPLELNEAGGRVSVRYITALHNGYVFLLTKVGLVGLLLFVYVMAYLYLVARVPAGLDMSEQRCRAGRLLQACVVTLAATTYIIAGVFNKQDMYPFLLMTGFLLAYFRIAERGH